MPPCWVFDIETRRWAWKKRYDEKALKGARNMNADNMLQRWCLMLKLEGGIQHIYYDERPRKQTFKT